MLLDKIEKANDIKKIDKSDYGELAEEIRQFLIQKISVTGGHLGSNLGAVELTMALHLALNLPEDKIICFFVTGVALPAAIRTVFPSSLAAGGIFGCSSWINPLLYASLEVNGPGSTATTSQSSSIQACAI